MCKISQYRISKKLNTNNYAKEKVVLVLKKSRIYFKNPFTSLLDKKKYNAINIRFFLPEALQDHLADLVHLDNKRERALL